MIKNAQEAAYAVGRAASKTKKAINGAFLRLCVGVGAVTIGVFFGNAFSDFAKSEWPETTAEISAVMGQVVEQARSLAEDLLDNENGP